MSQNRKTISIAALSAALGLIAGVATMTARATAYARTIAAETAEFTVAPVRSELHHHLEDVRKAMSPGGPMYDRIDRLDDRDAFLVEAVSALCLATPAAPCPSPARLVRRHQ